MATVNLTTTPVQIDDGSSYAVLVTNTGAVTVELSRGGRLRPAQATTVYPEGAALTAATTSGTGVVTTSATTKPLPNAADPATLAASSAFTGTYAPINGSANYAPSNYRQRGTASLMKGWIKGLARVRNGGGDAKILCIGDSTTAGFGSTAVAGSPPQGGWPSRLTQILTSAGLPAARGLAVPPNNGDNRWATTWSTATGFGFGNKVWTAAGTPTMTYADPGVNADKIDVYYIRATGLGTITTTFGGGTPVGQSTAGAQAVLKSTATATGAATSNSASFAPTGTNYIVAVEPWLSTTSKVRVGNAGFGGTKASDWTGYSGALGAVSSIAAYAPDVTIINFGKNDATAAVDPTAFMTNVRTLIAGAQAAGSDVILWSSSPSGTANGPTYEPQYAAQLAAQTDCVYVDVYGRYGNYAGVQALGFNYDTQHLTDAGYWDVAQAFATVLLNV